MRILHVIQRYHPAVGGAELHMQEISAWLAAAGHQVTVVTSDALDFELFWDPRRRRVAEPSGTHRGVQIRRFPMRHLPISHLAFPGIRRLLWLLSMVRPVPEGFMSWLARYTPWTPALWRWANTQTERYDLVGAMTTAFEPFVEAGLRVARRQGAPFVCYPLTHLGAGPEPGDDANSRFYIMRHQVGLVAASDAVIAQTESEREFYVGRGVDAGKIAVVGPGVTPEAVLGGDGEGFRRRHGIHGPLVLAIGAMAADKGTVQTVEAVRRLWHAGREVELVLIGAVLTQFGAYLDGLPAADRERIHVLGPVSDDEKRDALAAATLYAMPSRTDSFGITYLEAWLYGLPVIGARTWGVMDLIEDGRDGLLVPYDHKPAQSGAPALAQAIAYLIDHPAEAARMGQAGREKVYAGHTWDIKCRMVEEIYRGLVEKVAAS
jgi:glycosyltransferase involved in cell wall biosynthesis